MLITKIFFGDLIPTEYKRIREIEDKKGNKHYPMDLTELRLLQMHELLRPEQDEALKKLVELVEKHEDANGLPISLLGFWRNNASLKIKVDEEALGLIESYLTPLGVPYTKDETSIRVDKYNGTSRRYTGATTKSLHFSLNPVS